ncbi:FAD dependent oxidoreductase domain-containing protein [Hirsutella rhossiliensis]|uniref:FAD dependent oxidoreductase domain-containing protein n=1 Tax=Hirsutella rhossiliensis TaxID=111463 RepID=A0A9P8SE99_9HYPO|nr:FAD dependent oxidoreductase domain-containing protein [Hirsutella rhossiliensis]KAH0958175.1 FAD dependent oxidoreductase domain-containing protein [Hirsutella rhossiliensis]
MTKSSTSRDAIVIVGAGIAGLDVALVLAERGFGPLITVVAQFLPGDTSPEYTSPWAGCNFSAVSGSDEKALRWDRLGYAHLGRMASEHGREAFVARTHSIEYWDASVPHDKIRTMSEYLEDFRMIPPSELPPGVQCGVSCTTLAVNAPRHLEYLHRRLRDDLGVRFVRRRLDGIRAAFATPATRLVFNCTGNAARTLPGVEDPLCFPTRGQVVLVRAPAVSCTMMRYGSDYTTYVIPRPGSNGNVILGGFMQKGNSDAATYAHETESILFRTSALCPELRRQPFEVLAAFAGLRPSREGGARVERSDMSVGGTMRALVHNYGAGGTGFQAGYGFAVDAVATAEDVLRELRGGEARSSHL